MSKAYFLGDVEEEHTKWRERNVPREERIGWVAYLLVLIFFFVLVGWVLADDLAPIGAGGSGGGRGLYPVATTEMSQRKIERMREEYNKAVEYMRDIAGDFELPDIDPERKKVGLKLLEELDALLETDEICPNFRHPIFWCLSPDEVKELSQVVGDDIPPYAEEVETALQEWAANGHANAGRQLQWLVEYKVEFERIWSYFWKETMEMRRALENQPRGGG